VVLVKLKVILTRLYENVISKFRNIEDWSEEIQCNIKVKQECHLFPTIFGIYIDELEECLEDASCVGPMLIGIVIILLLYDGNIVLLEMSHYSIGNQLRILQDFYSKKGVTINTYKTKIMIIKSKNITYDTFIYDDNLGGNSSIQIIGINIHHKFNWNYSIENRINGG